MRLIEFGGLTKFIEPLAQHHLQSEEMDEDSLEVPDDSPQQAPFPEMTGALPVRCRHLPAPPAAAPRIKGCVDFAETVPLLGSPAVAKKLRQRGALGGDAAAAAAPAKLLLPFSKVDDLEAAAAAAAAASASAKQYVCHFPPRSVAVSIDELIAQLTAAEGPLPASALVLTRLQ